MASVTTPTLVGGGFNAKIHDCGSDDASKYLNCNMSVQFRWHPAKLMKNHMSPSISIAQLFSLFVDAVKNEDLDTFN